MNKTFSSIVQVSILFIPNLKHGRWNGIRHRVSIWRVVVVFRVRSVKPCAKKLIARRHWIVISGGGTVFLQPLGDTTAWRNPVFFVGSCCFSYWVIGGLGYYVIGGSPPGPKSHQITNFRFLKKLRSETVACCFQSSVVSSWGKNKASTTCRFEVFQTPVFFDEKKTQKWRKVEWGVSPGDPPWN